MLVSNWDNKDVRDVARGSNTAIFEYRMGRDALEARYLIIDWGAALGTWGSNVLSRGRWDCQAFAGAERTVRARHGRRHRVVGLQRAANGRRRRRTSARSDVQWLYNISAGLATSRSPPA